MVIEFVGKQQYFHLNNKQFSAYPDEQEVLLQDGIQYRVVEITSETKVINVGPKEYSKEVTVVRLQNIRDDY